MLRIQRLTRNGSALAITVPAPMLRELQWHKGDLIALRLASNGVTATRVDEKTLGDIRRTVAGRVVKDRA